MGTSQTSSKRFSTRRVAAWLIVAFTGVALLELGAALIDPPVHEVRVDLQGTGDLLVLQLVQTHSYLAEYHRRLVLRRNDVELAGVDLFPDTGGYGRAHL